MHKNKTEVITPPYLKYSLLSFQEYCNRDFLSHHALLFNRQQKLYTNARNRRKITLNTSNTTFYKKQTENQSQRGRKYLTVDSQQLKQKVTNHKPPTILNIAPAVIHSTVSSKMTLMLSQRAKTEVRQPTNTKVFRCKTVCFDLSSEGSSLSLKETAYSHNPTTISRPNTAKQNLAGLNKIKVCLPSRSQNTNAKEEQINPWDFYEDQGI